MTGKVGRPKKALPKRDNGQGTISRESNGGWSARITIGGQRIKRRAATEDEAREKLKELRESIGFVDLTRGTPTVAELVDKHLSHLAQTKGKNGKPRSQAGLAVKADRLRIHIANDPRIGPQRIDRVSTSMVQSWLLNKQETGKELNDGRRVPYSAAYLRDLRSDIAQLFKWAVRMDYAKYNPTVGIELPNAAEPVAGNRLTREDAGRALAALATTNYRYAEFLFAVLVTGARPDEIASLRWTDLDADTCVVHLRKSFDRVKGKAIVLTDLKTSASVRDVEALPQLFTMLREWRKQQMAERMAAGKHWSGEWDDHVFLTQLGRPPSMGCLLRAQRLIFAEAGIKNVVTNYDLRRTCLSIMADSGADLLDIVAQAGHVDERMAIRFYIKREDKVARGASRSMLTLVPPAGDATQAQ